MSLKNITLSDVREQISHYLPSQADHIVNICLFVRDEGKPWGFDHVQILAELAGLPDEDPSIKRLTVAYILLCHYFFIMDAVMDGHLADSDRFLYAPLIFFIGLQIIEEELAEKAPSEERQWLIKRISERLLENAQALRTERARRQTWFNPNQDDIMAAIGRSNPVLLFYDILCVVNGRKPDELVVDILSRLIYCLQMGDDLGDWEHDLKSGNHTVLLRECAARLTPEKRDDIKEIEKELFLGGVYESFTARLVQDLDRILEQLKSLEYVKSEKAQAYVLKAKNKAMDLLRSIVETKISYLMSHASNEKK